MKKKSSFPSLVRALRTAHNAPSEVRRALQPTSGGWVCAQTSCYIKDSLPRARMCIGEWTAKSGLNFNHFFPKSVHNFNHSGASQGN